MGADAAVPSDLFHGFPDGLAICRAVQETVAAFGEVTMKVTRSQVAFRRRRGFAYVWRPGQYVKNDVPAVLSIALPRDVKSARVKEVVHPSPGMWMHHIELYEDTEVDEQVVAWLAEAYANAG